MISIFLTISRQYTFVLFLSSIKLIITHSINVSVETFLLKTCIIHFQIIFITMTIVANLMLKNRIWFRLT